MNQSIVFCFLATAASGFAQPPKPTEKNPNLASTAALALDTSKEVGVLLAKVEKLNADIAQLKTESKLKQEALSRLDEIAASNKSTQLELAKLRDSLSVINEKLKTTKDSSDEGAQLSKLVREMRQSLDLIRNGIAKRGEEVVAIVPKNPQAGRPFAAGSRWVGTLTGPRGILTSEWTVSENDNGKVSGTIILAGGREISQFAGTLRDRTLHVEQFMTPTGVRGRTIAQFTLTSDGTKFNGTAVGKLSGTTSGKFTLTPKK